MRTRRTHSGMNAKNGKQPSAFNNELPHFDDLDILNYVSTRKTCGAEIRSNSGRAALHNFHECRFKRGAADEKAVNVWLLDEVWGVFWSRAATVLNPHFVSYRLA